MNWMKNSTILLVGSEPESMPRLKLVYKCLILSGFKVKVFSSFKKGGSRFGKIGSIIRYFSNMTKLFFERADVYHFFNIPDVLGLPLLLKRGTLVYDVRSPWEEEVHDTTKNRILSKIAGIVERMFCLKADVVIAANSLLAQRSISFGAKGCEVVPNYPYRKMNTEGWENLINVSEATIFYFGKISKVEGSELLGDIIIGALESCDGYYRKHIRFIIAGDGSELIRLKQRILDAGADDKVSFLGWVPHEEIGQWIKAADLCIMPREEFGTSHWIHPDSVWKVNEALCIGTPVLTTKIGGFDAHIKYETLSLFTTTNEQFVGSMIDLSMSIRNWGKPKPADRNWRKCQKKLNIIYEGIK